jgi:hypothetical protein
LKNDFKEKKSLTKHLNKRIKGFMSIPKRNSLRATYIIESQYFPVVDWFKFSTDCSDIKIEQYERFQKMSFRNRCMILGSNGVINLTVPIENGRESKAMIRDIKVDNGQPWQKQHWRSILSSYSRSPFFEYYADGVNKLLQKQHIYLFDLNWEIIEWLQKALKLKANFELTEDYVREYDQDKFTDRRNYWLPKNYNREAEGWTPKYTQVFGEKFGFHPNLSILDLLFCRGQL